MLKFDKTKFEVVPAVEGSSQEYVLIAKADITLGNDQNRTDAKKGSVVLRGNEELFYGEDVESWFEDSYVDPDISFHLNKKSHISFRNSTILRSKDKSDHGVFSLNLKDIAIFDNSSLVIDPLIDKDSSDYSVGRFYSENSNIRVLLDATKVDPDKLFSNVSMKNVQGVNDLDPLRIGSVIFDKNIFATLENVDISPRSFLSLLSKNSYMDNESPYSKYDIKNVKLENNSLSLRCKKNNIQNFNINVGFEDFSIDADECEIIGFCPDDKPLPCLYIKDFKHHNKTGKMPFSVGSIYISAQEKANISLLKKDEKEISNKGSHVSIVSGRDTSTSVSLDTFSSRCINIFIKNETKERMDVDVKLYYENDPKDFVYQVLQVIDSSIVDSWIKMKGQWAFVLSNDSLIKSSNLYFYGNNCDHAKLKYNINKAYCGFEKNTIGDGTKINIDGSIKSKEINFNISESVFDKNCELNIFSSKERSWTSIDFSHISGVNFLKDIGRIKDTRFRDCALEDIGEVELCNLYSTTLGNIDYVNKIKTDKEYYVRCNRLEELNDDTYREIPSISKERFKKKDQVLIKGLDKFEDLDF